MAPDTPDRSPRDHVQASIPWRRNLLIGAFIGSVLATGAFTLRVTEAFGPAPPRGSPLLFLSLSLVLGVTTGALVAGVLSAIAGASALRSIPRQPAREDGESSDHSSDPESDRTQ